MEISDFAANVEETALLLEQMEAKAIGRHAELTENMGKFKKWYSEEEENCIKMMMEVLESENKEYK